MDSFVETDDHKSIHANKNYPVQMDVSRVISTATKPVPATNNVGIPAISVSVIDQSHTGSNCFQISDERTKHDGFDEMTRRNQGLITQQKTAFMGGMHTKALDLHGSQPMDNINRSDRLLSVVSSHACECSKWCKCCKSHVAESTMEPQTTSIAIHQTAIDPKRTVMDLQRAAIDLQRTVIDFEKTAIDQKLTAIDTQKTEDDSWKKYESSTEAAITDIVTAVENLKKRKWHRKFHRNNNSYSFTKTVRRPPGLRGTIARNSSHITRKGKDLSSSTVTPRIRSWLKRSKKCKKFKKVYSAKSTVDEGSFTVTAIG